MDRLGVIPVAFIGEDKERLSLAVDYFETAPLSIEPSALLKLCVFEGRLSIEFGDFKPLSVDFLSAQIKKRRQEGKRQALIRACDAKPGIKILDATAGWGRDAALLALFGAEVLMIERHPLMATLLADGLNRLNQNHSSLSLKHIDARDYLLALEEGDYPDVIYIDPMHPSRQKSAQVKKDMQVLQSLASPEDDLESFIKIAIQRVKQRVVVKWPEHAKAVLKPNRTIEEGKIVRFDIYLPS